MLRIFCQNHGLRSCCFVWKRQFKVLCSCRVFGTMEPGDACFYGILQKFVRKGERMDWRDKWSYSAICWSQAQAAGDSYCESFKDVTCTSCGFQPILHLNMLYKHGVTLYVFLSFFKIIFYFQFFNIYIQNKHKKEKINVTISTNMQYTYFYAGHDDYFCNK